MCSFGYYPIHISTTLKIRLTAADGMYLLSPLLQGEGYLGSINRHNRVRHFTGTRRASWTGVNAQLRAREEDKRNHSVVQRLLNEAGNHTIFTHRYVSLWSYGPVDGSFPERSLRPSQGGRQVPYVATASPEALVEHDGGFVVWDMLLSIACAATDAEYQNRIILHGNTLNLPVVARPLLRAAHGGAQRCRRLEDQPRRVVVSMPGARGSMQPLALLAVRRFNSRSS